MDVVSPKYVKKEYYKTFCEGRMPRLLDVPGFDGILIHPGTTEADSAGCLLVGKNKEVGKLLQSRDTWCDLYDILDRAHANQEDITIDIVRK